MYVSNRRFNKKKKKKIEPNIQGNVLTSFHQ